MQVQVVHRPANAAAKLILAPGETVTTESGAMIAMSGDTTVQTSTLRKQSGGVLKALRRLLAGESFFVNHFTAGSHGGEVWVAPTLSGDILALESGPEHLIVQSGSYLAGSHNLEIDLGWQGFKALFAHESIFWLRIGGAGTLVLNSFGAIYPIDIDGEYLVDTGHIVAFPESMRFKISRPGRSWLTAFLGGEGLVCRFSGKGRIWCQSHNAHAFGSFLGSMLRPREA